LSGIISCKPTPQPEPIEPVEKGVWVTNEGVFGQTSGSLTHYSPTDGKVQQKIFKAKNNRDLGNVVQSMAFVNDKAYIVVNNSNKVEIADANTFEELGQILNLEQPRYFLKVNDQTAYISQWGNDLLTGSIAVVNLNTNTVSQIIRTGIGKGPERMLLHNNKVYVVNVGGLEIDNFITTIDPITHTVEARIQVADAPNSLQITDDGDLWVACSGKTVYSSYPIVDTTASTAGALLLIDLQNNSIKHRIDFSKGKGAQDLLKGAVDEFFFYQNGQIYQLLSSSKQWQPVVEGNFYGLGYDDANQLIYAASYAGIQPAWVYRYRLGSWEKVDSFKAGVFANDFYFE